MRRMTSNLHIEICTRKISWEDERALPCFSGFVKEFDKVPRKVMAVKETKLVWVNGQYRLISPGRIINFVNINKECTVVLTIKWEYPYEQSLVYSSSCSRLGSSGRVTHLKFFMLKTCFWPLKVIISLESLETGKQTSSKRTEKTEAIANGVMFQFSVAHGHVVLVSQGLGKSFYCIACLQWTHKKVYYYCLVNQPAWDFIRERLRVLSTFTN